jgi:uncharacterized membrane protein YiaA
MTERMEDVEGVVRGAARETQPQAPFVLAVAMLSLSVLLACFVIFGIGLWTAVRALL